MDIYSIEALQAAHDATGDLYHEFLRVPTMSAGLYVLPAGSQDPQLPHTEDEVYVVMDGQGRIEVAGNVQPVKSGTVVFVPAGIEHRFRDIEQDLHVLVIFAPAESLE